jgi:O-antigen/teichoic acid export membrane protein
MVFADLDQWLIAAWAGLPGLGLYGPAILLGGVVRMWPASHRAVYAAELSRQRDTASWTAWQPQIDAALHLTAYGLPLVAVTLVALADPFIRLAFPAHVQSIAVAKWVILANLWYAVGAVAAVFCQAAQAPQWSWRTTALALAHATLTGWMLTSGRGLPGVAIGLFLTYAVYAVTQVRALCDTLRAPEGAWRKLLGRVSLPILLTVALCAVIETLLPLPATRAGMALVSLDRLVIGAAASGWFWWWTARRWPVARRTA